jgi:hypothetical protein
LPEIRNTRSLFIVYGYFYIANSGLFIFLKIWYVINTVIETGKQTKWKQTAIFFYTPSSWKTCVCYVAFDSHQSFDRNEVVALLQIVLTNRWKTGCCTLLLFLPAWQKDKKKNITNFDRHRNVITSQDSLCGTCFLNLIKFEMRWKTSFRILRHV